MTTLTTDEILGTLRQVIAGNQEFTTWTVSTPHIVALVKRYVEAEREACAKVCEDIEVEETHYCMNIYEEGTRYKFAVIEAIRARGNT